MSYVESQFGFEKMLAVYDETKQQLSLLCKEPNLGRRVPTKSENHRKFVLHRNLTVYYEMKAEVLEVYAFWNNNRDPFFRPE